MPQQPERLFSNIRGYPASVQDDMRKLRQLLKELTGRIDALEARIKALE